MNYYQKEKNLSISKKWKDVKIDSIMPRWFELRISKIENKKEMKYQLQLLFNFLVKMSNCCTLFARRNVPTKIVKRSANRSKNKEPTKYFSWKDKAMMMKKAKLNEKNQEIPHLVVNPLPILQLWLLLRETRQASRSPKSLRFADRARNTWVPRKYTTNFAKFGKIKPNSSK